MLLTYMRAKIVRNFLPGSLDVNTSLFFRDNKAHLYQLLYIHRFVECYMIKIKVTIVIIAILIVGLIVNSAGLAIPNAQSTSDEGNNNTQSFDDDNKAQTSDDDNKAQTSDDDNKAQTSDDDNKAQTSDDDNILTFNQELLPDLLSSNQKIIDITPLGTLNQSGNLQNPSIQTKLNKSLPFSQNTLESNYKGDVYLEKDCYRTDGTISKEGKYSMQGWYSCSGDTKSCLIEGIIMYCWANSKVPEIAQKESKKQFTGHLVGDNR